MNKKTFLPLMPCFFIAFLINGCSGETSYSSSGGKTLYSHTNNDGPMLDNPLPKSSHITVASTLSGYTQLNNGRNYPFDATITNKSIQLSVAFALNDLSYSNISPQTLPSKNPLNSGFIDSTRVDDSGTIVPALSPTAKSYINQTLKKSDTDVIILITNTPQYQNPFEMSCGQYKTQISLNYKIYVIDAHTLNLLTWDEANMRESISSNSICQQANHIPPKQINYAIQPAIHGFSKGISNTAKNLLANTNNYATSLENPPPIKLKKPN